MTFPCTKCGACCRRAFVIPNFPLPLNPDGSCSKLVGDECSIYAERPDICRYGHSIGSADPAEYARFTAQICNRLQIADGMPESYRVKID
jgi:Fe-S-cluster containining protein